MEKKQLLELRPTFFRIFLFLFLPLIILNVFILYLNGFYFNNLILIPDILYFLSFIFFFYNSITVFDDKLLIKYPFRPFKRIFEIKMSLITQLTVSKWVILNPTSIDLIYSQNDTLNSTHYILLLKRQDVLNFCSKLNDFGIYVNY